MSALGKEISEAVAKAQADDGCITYACDAAIAAADAAIAPIVEVLREVLPSVISFEDEYGEPYADPEKSDIIVRMRAILDRTGDA